MAGKIVCGCVFVVVVGGGVDTKRTRTASFFPVSVEIVLDVTKPFDCS